MRRLSLAFVLACAFLGDARGWEPARNAEGELGDHITSLKAQSESAFVAECQIDDTIKAAVVFPIDSQTGSYFIIKDQIRPDYAYATTTGEIEVLGTSFRIRIFDSTVVDLDRQLATNLMGHPFHLRTPDKLDLIFTERALNGC